MARLIFCMTRLDLRGRHPCRVPRGRTCRVRRHARRPRKSEPPKDESSARPEFKAAGVCARCHVVSVLEWGISKHVAVGHHLPQLSRSEPGARGQRTQRGQTRRPPARGSDRQELPELPRGGLPRDVRDPFLPEMPSCPCPARSRSAAEGRRRSLRSASEELGEVSPACRPGRGSFASRRLAGCQQLVSRCARGEARRPSRPGAARHSAIDGSTQPSRASPSWGARSTPERVAPRRHGDRAGHPDGADPGGGVRHGQRPPRGSRDPCTL